MFEQHCRNLGLKLAQRQILARDPSTSAKPFVHVAQQLSELTDPRLGVEVGAGYDGDRLVLLPLWRQVFAQLGPLGVDRSGIAGVDKDE
ncbi:hypothetical protein ACFQZZ_23340 [Nocardia sp. GCM10030253]|uniref:hypothetical protein n=1 Tax=Nocardia sp. GCM10030253 TaxID=3273404 RepID=UPI003634FF95